MQAKFALFICFFFTTCSAKPSGVTTPCNAPPALWCDDPQITQWCGATDACAAYNKTVFGQKIKITLLYESLCPYCQNFIITMLYPEVFLYQSDFVELEVIPFGNAKVMGNNEFSCQHGPEECALNKLHSCAINQLKDYKKYFPFIYCMEKDMQAKDNPTTSAKNCLNWASVSTTDQEAIDQCYKGDLGNQLQLQASQQTAAILPEKHTYVPWILVNDVSTLSLQGYQGDLFDVLCSWYKGPKTPANC